MQTRKRAKSVTFGKKTKEEKEHLKKAAEEEAAPSVAEKETDKTESMETKESPKEATPELSATPPKTEEETPGVAVETPSNEFVSDNPLSTAPEASKEAKEQEPAAESAQPAAVGGELSEPVETTVQPTTTPEPQGTQPPSQELSSTLPPSAFTIESNEQSGQPVSQQTAGIAEGAEPEKKRFGLYFLVVAFLAFVLGLGAMAGASYLGLVNVNFAHLPAGVKIPGLLGQKPTPTIPPPTVAPTQKLVDLTAFTITVLNGSGISGKAADEKTELTTAGFKVTSTGNASNSNFTKTEISAKKTVSHDFIVKLQDELQKSFDVDATIATSPDSDSTDVTITIGSQTAQ